MVMDKPGLPKSVSLSSFRERSFAPAPYDYDFQGEPYYLGPPRPGSPTILRLSVPIITTTPPPPDTPATPITPKNLLSVPVRNPNCYKVPRASGASSNLREDIFQEHQARLINCDSEDASAFHHWTQMPEKVDVVRYPTKRDSPAPGWLELSLERAQKPMPPGRWYPLSHAKPWKSDIYLTKSGEWKLLGADTVEDDTFKAVKDPILRSKSADDLIEHIFSSSSECEFNNNSFSPKSTDSSDAAHKTQHEESPGAAAEVVVDSKLTKEERLKALKELDEIVNGMDKITEFGQRNFAEFHCDVKNLFNPQPTLKSSSSKPSEPVLIPAADSSASCSSNDGDFEYGSGRVAALAKLFSQMGEAGIIRGRGGKFVRDRYKSEPTISFVDSEISPKAGDIILPPEAFMTDNIDCELVLKSNGLRHVGFSMDRLIDIGHEIIVKEIKPEMAEFTRIEPEVCNESQKIPKSALSENGPVTESSKKLVQLSPRSSPIFLRRKAPLLDPNRKSISVDEIEMRKRSNSGFHKHYSLVELINVDKLNTSGVESVEKIEDKPKVDAASNFCTSENIHKMYNGHGSRDMRRWMSVDDSVKSLGWTEKLKEKDRLDFGSRDVLHKKCKPDAIKGRKNRRLKKLELQRSFVVSPVKLGHLGNSEDPNILRFRSLDPGPVEGQDESRKL